MEGNKGIGRQFLGCEVIITLIQSPLQSAIAGNGVMGKVFDYDDNFIFLRAVDNSKIRIAVNIRQIESITEYTEEMKLEDEAEECEEDLSSYKYKNTEIKN